jgi:hypothetical protein
MKKSTPPPPPNSNRFKISDGLTVLGRPQRGVPGLLREPISDATLKQLKSMLAKIEAEKAKAAKEAKKNAKIIKKQNKQAVKKADPVRKAATQKAPKKVIKVAPRRGGGMRGGGFGGGGGGFPGNVNQ